MAVISKDLGAVTAYAAAVNRGYTGTKEEFETLMASYATVAQQAAQSAGNASQSATDASQSATDAETAKGTAQQAATDAQNAQASAQESAQSAQQSAQSASQSAQTAESAKETAVDAVDGFEAGAQQALDGVNQAGNNWKSLAERQAENSEAWAVGQRDGEDVGSSDPAYHNNAKYYAESVGTSAQTATEAAQTATQKASEAQASASAAAESARTLTIDATLTQAGQVADSKAVGDKIGNLTYIRKTETDNAYIDSSTGSVVITSAWAYVTYNVEGLDGETVSIKTKLYDGSAAGWAVFLKDGSYFTGGTSESATIALPTNVGSVKISCFKNALPISGIGFSCNFSGQLAYAKDIPDVAPIKNSVFYSETILYSNNKDVWVKGFLTNNGQVTATNTWRTTDYIKIYGSSEVLYKLSMYAGVCYVAFYNAEKEYIADSAIAATITNNYANKYTEGSLTIPNSAAYFRMSFRADNDTNYGSQQVTIKNARTDMLADKLDSLEKQNKITARILIIGDSYSANSDKWISPMMEEFSNESSYISLAVSSATVKDQSNDRSMYPYTSRPSSLNTNPNTNTLSCQIAKLKRLMNGTDLDEGESAIYQTEAEYPNIIIIQGGENDWKDANTNAYNEQFEVKVDNVYYSRWGNVSQGSVYLKPDVETVNRTTFAGAYRYIMDELYSLFPKAQYFFTTTSPVAPHQNPVLSLRREIAEQQRLCANMCCVSIIDWQAESQMSIIANSVLNGDGTQSNPYVVTPATQDSTDGLHPSEYGGKKLGKLAASVINSKFMRLS